LIDDHTKVVSQLRNHLETLQATEGEIRQGDVLQILASPPDGSRYDIVFIDPPFSKGLITPSVESLESNGWLAGNARIYIEIESNLKDLNLPDNWEILRQQKVGQVTCYLAARHPSTPES
jgi:16S rRNA (guanine966-N2)-methyltransferase